MELWSNRIVRAKRVSNLALGPGSSNYIVRLGGYHFLRNGGVPNILGIINVWIEKQGDHKIFADQNVGSHKMTTDSVFILSKKTDFNTILGCLGGKVYRWWGS